MDKSKALKGIREDLNLGRVSLGSWIQSASLENAQIIGRSGYDWAVIDMEHGSISNSQLPMLFYALESGGTLPLVRVAEATERECRLALDAGAGGVLLPMIKTSEQLESVIDFCTYPPAGKRGVGFCHGNNFGKDFDVSMRSEQFQRPLIIAMIEHVDAFKDLNKITSVTRLDATFVGPYDLSASMGITGKFNAVEFSKALETIKEVAKSNNKPRGFHVVNPSEEDLGRCVNEGYQFIAYSLDTVFLRVAARRPSIVDE